MRLLALAVAFVFAGAPIAAELCETTCVEHVGHSVSTSGGSHLHHGSSTTEHAGHHAASQKTRSTDPDFAPSVSHDCCYTVAILNDSRDSKQGSAPTVLLTMPSIGAVTMVLSQPARVSHRHRLPVFIHPLSQLRV
jgi:hypothetical protein